MTSVLEENMTYLKREELNGNMCPSKIWILIEYRALSGNSKTTTYEVVDAKDVCSGRANVKLEYHTGKTVYVKKENTVVQATIVTISDDKSFLEAELKGLEELKKADQEHVHKKRRRLPAPKNENCLVSYNRWSSRESNESPTQSVIISNPNVQNYPPMTFDQQTQTDTKITAINDLSLSGNDSRLNKILQNDENIIRSQHSLIVENQEMKKQISDLNAQMSEMKEMLNDVLHKIDGIYTHSPNHPNNGSILNYSQISTPGNKTTNTSNPPRILNLSHQSYTPQYYTSINIEPVEASNDSSTFHSNSSRVSLSASNQSIYHGDISQSQSSLNNSDLNGAPKERKFNVAPENGDNFMDEEGNADDEVVIGSNNTTVPRSVLMNINWNLHTAATRRLLCAKFTREVLATHSLTGKPSPGMFAVIKRPFHQRIYSNFILFSAFMESSKPTKNQLDPLIIADIVSYVSKRCKVTDTAVRSSITTKCADENKMLRQRMEKNRKVLMKIENKENVKKSIQSKAQQNTIANT